MCRPGPLVLPMIKVKQRGWVHRWTLSRTMMMILHIPEPKLMCSWTLNTTWVPSRVFQPPNYIVIAALVCPFFLCSACGYYITFQSIDMFSHSHEVSIHGEKFNNVGRDSVVLSNSNNTIYQNYGHVLDNRFCLAPYSLLGLQDDHFAKGVKTSSKTGSAESSTPKSPSSIDLPSPELLVHKNSSMSTLSVLCTCDCGSGEESLKSLKIGINIQVDVSDGRNSPSELQPKSEELFSELALPNVAAEQSINSVITSTHGYSSIEEVRRVLSFFPTSRKPDLFKVLSFLIYSYDDLPLSSIASLLFPDVLSSLCELLSFVDLIISTPHDNDRLGFIHPSLKLFFDDRSCAGGFFVSYVRGDGILLQCCTEYMKRLNWGSPGDGIESVDEQALEYACRYWKRHRSSLDVVKL
ncbi:hypothetical protein BDQ17DRAFT_1045210 [Cyathus striatus]|nr:hypothetical protein BDQ17DRAFT_1045210 [Cyathus striatus]